MNFFVINDINIHQLNIGPSRSIKLLVEKSLKKCVSFNFFSNKGKIIYAFKENTNTK